MSSKVPHTAERRVTSPEFPHHASLDKRRRRVLRSGVMPRELIPRAPQTRQKKEMEARKARLEYARIQKAKASLAAIKRQRLAEGLAKAEKRAKEDKVRPGSCTYSI